MPFAYYKKLSRDAKNIYLESEAVTSLRLPWAKEFRPFILALAEALASESQEAIQKLSQKLVDALSQVFNVPKIQVKVLARRPSHGWGELHGLYELGSNKTRPVMTVWMRTAKRKQVVAFKTFLRTILHEFIHHLDYTHLKLADSFHTEGFYKRESSLLKQLLPFNLQGEIERSFSENQ